MRKYITAAIIAVGAIVFTGELSLAQQTQKQSMLSNADRQFLTNTAFGSTYEFELAQLSLFCHFPNQPLRGKDFSHRYRRTKLSGKAISQVAYGISAAPKLRDYREYVHNSLSRAERVD